VDWRLGRRHGRHVVTDNMWSLPGASSFLLCTTVQTDYPALHDPSWSNGTFFSLSTIFHSPFGISWLNLLTFPCIIPFIMFICGFSPVRYMIGFGVLSGWYQQAGLGFFFLSRTQSTHSTALISGIIWSSECKHQLLLCTSLPHQVVVDYLEVGPGWEEIFKTKGNVLVEVWYK